jgi:hypothetical protein
MEYVKYKLRTIYRCLPSELRQQTGQDLLEMFRDLECLAMETKAQNQRQRLKSG